MKIFVLYDSLYGNTKKVAEVIGKGIDGDVKVAQVSKLDPSELKDLDILIVGAPTHGGRPSPATQKFLEGIPKGFLKNIKVAAFDTRYSNKDHSALLGFFMKIIGFAAPKIAKKLKKGGGDLVVEPEGFIVEGKEGPLKKGELERAGKWGNIIGNNPKMK